MIKKFSKLKKRHQLLFAIIITFAVVCLWRGIWGLLDIFIFPDNLFLSYSITCLVGIAIMALANLSIDKLI